MKGAHAGNPGPNYLFNEPPIFRCDEERALAALEIMLNAGLASNLELYWAGLVLPGVAALIPSRHFNPEHSRSPRVREISQILRTMRAEIAGPYAMTYSRYAPHGAYSL